MVRREYFAGGAAKLAQAALRLSPGASYFVVSQNGKQIGFASTTVDTVVGGVDVVDYFIADLPDGAATRRNSSRSIAKLSRALALRSFDLQTEIADSSSHVGGRTDGDSAVVFALTASGGAADSQRVAVRGPVWLPSLAPLIFALGDAPKVGRSFTLSAFDPATHAPRTLQMAVRAESLFTLVDSARFDDERAEWVGAKTDTVRAWRLEPTAGAGFSGWIDAEGRVVASTQPDGLTLTRMAYEIAFENWRIARNRATALGGGAGAKDVLERTVIAAGAPLGRSRFAELKVRLAGTDLSGLDLAGDRQTFADDTVRVRRERAVALRPSWALAGEGSGAIRMRFAKELAAEPLLQTRDQRIVDLALRIAGDLRDPWLVTQKLIAWENDSLKKVATFGVPNAVDVLRTRRGDCNEHTQLFVALARALGIPARAVTGMIWVGGKFYYHAWAEVQMNEWVAVDPTFGQFPADAAHVRFLVGGLSRQAELMRILGKLTLKVEEAK